MKLFHALLAMSLLTSTAFAADTNNSPEGYWKTIDDVTGRTKSIIHIWKTQGQLVGKVEKIFPKEGTAEAKLCTACTGDNHNKPILGMVIISGLIPQKNSQWGNGSILDPENGKTYSCYARMAENGKKLDMHGYIGMPLLGRSQIWERV